MIRESKPPSTLMGISGLSAETTIIDEIKKLEKMKLSFRDLIISRCRMEIREAISKLDKKHCQ